MYFPKSQKADKELKAVCYNTAYGIYGKTLPETVLNRLEAELKIITQKGYSLIFMIMQKAVVFSESRGYHTNPRGCVGNSLAAYFSGISNINPLPPHYICSKCHPFFTGKQKLVDTGGRVEKFNRRFNRK